MKKVAFHTLGCKVNTYETEAVWEIIQKEGYEKVPFKQKADVYIINTCTVTNMGDSKSRNMIRRAIRTNPDAIVCVMGCYSQTKPNEVAEIEGVDIVIGTQKRHKILEYISEIYKKRQPINSVENIMKTKTFETLSVTKSSTRHRANIKIQEGCNNFCTYCIIPWARGLMRSRPCEEIINEINVLCDNGFKEFILTGIHTAGYGQDMPDFTFAMLLEKIALNCPKLQRLRISSIEASQVNSDVIEVFKKYKNIFANHIHVPLQSGSDTILKMMRRNYDTKKFLKHIQQIRSVFPDISITTDVIVGFPGESEELFNETFEFIKKVEFSELHVFPYSMRTGTPASKLKQVHDQDKTNRVKKLISLNNMLATNYIAKFINKEVDFIGEKYDENKNVIEGWTTNYIRLEVNGDKNLVGENIKVKITTNKYPLSKGQI